VQLVDAGISIRDKHWGEVEVMDSKLDQTLERTSDDVSSSVAARFSPLMR